MMQINANKEGINITSICLKLIELVFIKFKFCFYKKKYEKLIN